VLGVNWELVTGYDKNKKEEQIIPVEGSVILTKNIKNPRNTKALIHVKILAAGWTAPDFHPTLPRGVGEDSGGGDIFEWSENDSSGSWDDSDQTDTNDEYTSGEESLEDKTFEQWVTVTFQENHTHLFGIRTTTDIIERGSEFFVYVAQGADINNNKSLLDQDVKVENVVFLEVGVKKPDGTKYDTLSDAVKIYAEWPEGWDKEDQTMLRLMETKDVEREFLGFEEVNGITCATYSFPGFSPYAFIDKLNEGESKQVWWENNKPWVITLSVLVPLVAGAGVWWFFVAKKKKEEEEEKSK
jgi:hypothetical protein